MIRCGAGTLCLPTGLLLAFLTLAAQDFSEVRVELLTKGHGYTEGPAWSAKEGYLVFSDTVNDRLMRWVPGHDVEVFRKNAGGPSGNAFDAEGRLYTCEARARRVVRIDKKGGTEVLAEKWDGKLLNGPNDIAVSRNGNVWFTDPAFGEQADHRELNFYGVFHVTPKGEVKLVAKPVGRPNGIALSPNGRVLYVANSDERNIRAYDIDRNGEAANERIFAANLGGVPGGLRTDEAGNLYVAGKGVSIFNPQGKLLHSIESAGRISNVGFGEPDGKTLFLTAGSEVRRVRFEKEANGDH
jgi:gluconolactonase